MDLGILRSEVLSRASQKLLFGGQLVLQYALLAFLGREALGAGFLGE